MEPQFERVLFLIVLDVMSGKEDCLFMFELHGMSYDVPVLPDPFEKGSSTLK
jgi:hypothetical protein